MIAITSLLVVVALSLIVTRVATVLLVATGMSRQAARFQARSAFTGSGFTTRESEDVVSHPVRRRVVMVLMLLGNAGIVAVASSLIIGFRSGSRAQGVTLLELLVGLVALLAVSRSAWVDQRLTRAIRRLVARYTDLQTRDVASLLELTGHYAVGELLVEEGDWIAERPLGDLGLRDEGLAVLGINRPDGTHVGVPGGWSVIRPGDSVILYGRIDALDEIDRRPSGGVGERRHEVAVERQRLLTLTERGEEEAVPSGPP